MSIEKADRLYYLKRAESHIIGAIEDLWSAAEAEEDIEEEIAIFQVRVNLRNFYESVFKTFFCDQEISDRLKDCCAQES